MSEDLNQSNSFNENDSDNDSEPAVQHQMNPRYVFNRIVPTDVPYLHFLIVKFRVEAKINSLCMRTGLVMKQVFFYYYFHPEILKLLFNSCADRWPFLTNSFLGNSYSKQVSSRAGFLSVRHRIYPCLR